MRKIHVTRQFSRLAALRGTFSKKNKNPAFRYGLRECVYLISGMHLFPLWPKDEVQTHRPKYLQDKIGIFNLINLFTRPTARLTRILKTCFNIFKKIAVWRSIRFLCSSQNLPRLVGDGRPILLPGYS